MKNKKLLYILIPATLLLWGTVVFKIYNTVKGGDEEVTPFQNPINTEVPVTNNNDTFEINPDYRDPFTQKVNKPSVSNQGSLKRQSTIQKPVVTSWPSIVYNGMIKNQKSSKQLIIIQINGRSTSMKSGEVIDGVQLLKVFRDSIEVKFGKERKFITK